MEHTAKTHKYPFKFLDPYALEDRDIFFGRDQEIEELYQRVFRSNLILVYGQSGTGKTSLVQCGLASRFSDMDWFELFIRRGDDLNQSLNDAIVRSAVTPMAEGLTLDEKIESLYLDHFKPVYLIFDQFEELFILGDETEQSRFIRDIASALDRKVPLKVIIVMREEYLAQLYDFERILPSLMENRIRIEHMGRSNAISMIMSACAQATPPIALEEGIPQRIVDIVTEEKGRVQLTYLQVFLDKLYRIAESSGSENPVFDAEVLEEAGKIDDVLEDFADQQIADFTKQHHQKALALTFLKVFVSKQGTKVPLLRETVYQRMSQISRDRIDTCFSFFEQRRVLRPLENERFELAHDSIAAKIGAASIEAYKFPTMIPGYDGKRSALVGFQPYTEEHGKVFTGRDHEVRKLFNLVMNDTRSRSTLLYGKLGSGKTSVLRAGLIPRIAQYRKVRYVKMDVPFIEKEILPYLREPQPQGESLLWSAGPSDTARVIIWDQIEEWFTTIPSALLITRLFQWISEKYTEYSDHEFVWCVREECFAQINDLEGFLPGFMDKKYRLDELTKEIATDVIYSIAGQEYIEFEDAHVVDKMIEKLAKKDGRIEPTYLQVYLRHIIDAAKTEAA